MINTNDVTKALHLIAEEIGSKGHDIILSHSVSCGEYGVVVDVTLIEPSYKMSLQFNADLLER